MSKTRPIGPWRPTTRTARTVVPTPPMRPPDRPRTCARRRPDRTAIPSPPIFRRGSPGEELQRQREHGRPGQDSLPLGHLRPERQCGPDPGHAGAATSGLQLPAGLALLPRRRSQRPGLPTGVLGLQLLPGGHDFSRGIFADAIHFRYQGGQIRSLFSLISYLGKGEYRERYLGIKIPPTNIQDYHLEEARTFAKKLATTLVG